MRTLTSFRRIPRAWEKQLLNYLPATGVEVGLLFDFGPTFNSAAWFLEKKENKSA